MTIYGKQYIGALQFGRKPTENSGDGTLKEKISRWIDVKGIEPDGISKDSLAYLIAKKIHEEGTSIYRKYADAGTGLLDDVINENEISKLKNDLTFSYVMSVKSQIFKDLKLQNQ